MEERLGKLLEITQNVTESMPEAGGLAIRLTGRMSKEFNAAGPRAKIDIIIAIIQDSGSWSVAPGSCSSFSTPLSFCKAHAPHSHYHY